jgi:hypothetical protein
MAVPWRRRLVNGLSPRRPRLAPGSVHVRFVVDKVALGQVFLRVLRFSPANIIPPSLSKLVLVSSGGRTICPVVAAVQRHKSHPIEINQSINQANILCRVRYYGAVSSPFEVQSGVSHGVCFRVIVT